MGQIIGYHATVISEESLFLNHKGETGRSLNWLLANHSDPEYKKVAYDLDFFAAVLFRAMKLTRAEASKLLTTGKLHYYIDSSVYDITYYPSKYLGITCGAGWGRPYIGIYNAEQYIENGCHYEMPTPDIKDCKVKAQIARDTGVKVSQALFKLGLDANTITSPVRSMEKSLLASINLPTHLDIPPEVNDLAVKCCTGSWVEAYKLGWWQKAYDLDITACYASQLAQLYDTRQGNWIKSTNKPEKALYGFAQATITINSKFSPIIFKTANESSFTPTGTWETYLTKEAMNFIEQYQLGKFTIHDAWWWLPSGKLHQPMKGIVNHLYSKRENASPLENKILKRCLSGLWGRTLHTRVEKDKLVYGAAFNPVFGAIVETNAKLEVAKMVLNNRLYPDHLLHIAVDGILTDKEIELPTSNGLGKWHTSYIGGALIAGSGIATVESKAGAEDFALNYDKLLNLIKAEPAATSYTMKKIAGITLAKALATSKLDKLGELEEITRTITIGADNKRLYPEFPTTGGELLANHYNSNPLDITLLLLK